MARPQETEHTHRRSGIIRAVVLFALALGVLVYLIIPGCQRQTTTRSTEEFCKQIPSLATFSEALAGLDHTGVRNAIPALERLDEVAPMDIEPQVKVILETSRPMVTAVKDAQTDESIALDKVWRPKQPEVAKIQAAGKAVRDYTLLHCKIDLNTTATTPATTAAPTTAGPATAGPTTAAPTTAAAKPAGPTTTAKR